MNAFLHNVFSRCGFHTDSLWTARASHRRLEVWTIGIGTRERSSGRFMGSNAAADFLKPRVSCGRTSPRGAFMVPTFETSPEIIFTEQNPACHITPKKKKKESASCCACAPTSLWFAHFPLSAETMVGGLREYFVSGRGRGRGGGVFLPGCAGEGGISDVLLRSTSRRCPSARCSSDCAGWRWSSFWLRFPRRSSWTVSLTAMIHTLGTWSLCCRGAARRLVVLRARHYASSVLNVTDSKQAWTCEAISIQEYMTKRRCFHQ